MRVLLTTDWNPSSVNGVVTSVNNLKQGLEELGHEVRILSLSNSLHSYTEEDYYYAGSTNARFIYPGLRVRTTLALPIVREIVKWKPDVVHSNCEFSSFLPAKQISHHLHIPLVHTYHTVYEDYTHYFCPSARLGKFAVQHFSKFIAGQTDCVIAPTEKVKQLLIDYHVTQRLEVIPTGIACNRFESSLSQQEISDLKAQLKIPSDHLVLLFVGRLSKEKNCEELLHFMTRLQDAPVTLLIVGDGPYGQELRKQASCLPCHDRIIFTGMISPEQVTSYYQLGDIFSNASTSETQGLTYIEALSAGLALLCRADSCLDGVIIDGENGFQYHSEEMFLEKIHLLLSNPRMLQDFRAKSREICTDFSVPAFACKVQNLYQDLIADYHAESEKRRFPKWTLKRVKF